MTNDSTLSKLIDMRLSTMAEHFREQLRNPQHQELAFEERFSMLVDIEWSRRQNNKLDRLIKSAQFRNNQASIEDIEYHPDRKLDKAQILRLATGQYIEEHHNILLMGASGNGKTYLACAFGMAACRQFYKVKYVRVPDLLDELAVARGEGIFQKVMKANREGNLFDISLLLMNDLKSYLAQGLYWLVSSYPEDAAVTLELSTLAGHFHFLDDDKEPIMPVYKIVERIRQACEELQTVGFIERYEFKGKKQGLMERFLTVSKIQLS